MDGKTLKDLVVCYTENCLKNHPGYNHNNVDFDPLFDDAIQMRWHKRTVMDSHQTQLHKEPREEYLKNLEGQKDALRGGTSFEDVYKTMLLCKTDGVAQLTLYDTALRLCLPRGMKPKDVYLHSGARKGAGYIKKLIKNYYPIVPYLPKKNFPPELQVLESWEIENFLCVCKDQLCKLSQVAGGA
ncbi:MAG: hypothetical protein KKF77_02190 [Proteobacteria bacterium]|nr:hypothetical protein [Pseudomonadota bacterium]